MKPAPQPLDHRNERRYIRRVPGPHLAADRLTVIVQDDLLYLAADGLFQVQLILVFRQLCDFRTGRIIVDASPSAGAG
jgi:hypothetical protein